MPPTHDHKPTARASHTDKATTEERARQADDEAREASIAKARFDRTGAVSDDKHSPTRPGTFKVLEGRNPHVRQIPPVVKDGKVTKGPSEETIAPGQTFQAEGIEAASCRADGGGKFIEITDKE